MAHPRMAAGALFFDEADRVLLLEPSYKDYRDIPGGYVEQGESPLQACTREIHEELGIKPSIGRLLVVDWAPNLGEGDKVLYLFDGGRLSAEHRHQVVLQADEIRSYDFHHPERLPDLTIPRLVRRITSAIQARADGQTVYLEHGEPPQAGP
ncbi:NUDIX domain-containing protein [Streptomyces sp. NPDC005955]|uniref:NUDIX domain-containing protein n=1 Tax=Streptomyces sp. NPDC005955 TaxID=3364738 RepID=UPI0036AB6354